MLFMMGSKKRMELFGGGWTWKRMEDSRKDLMWDSEREELTGEFEGELMEGD